MRLASFLYAGLFFFIFQTSAHCAYDFFKLSENKGDGTGLKGYADVVVTANVSQFTFWF